jgi:hypothetical protein
MKVILNVPDEGYSERTLLFYQWHNETALDLVFLSLTKYPYIA